MRILNNPFELRSNRVTLISEKGEKKGDISTQEAFKMADAKGLNVALVSEKSDPPIVKLLDWGKYLYEKRKGEKKAKAKQKSLEMKEMRLSSNIDEHDFEFKRRRAEKFLEKGHALKLSLKLKGREHQFVEKSIAVLVDFSRKLSHLSTIEQTPQRTGGMIVSILRPKSKKLTENK